MSKRSRRRRRIRAQIKTRTRVKVRQKKIAAASESKVSAALKPLIAPVLHSKTESHHRQICPYCRSDLGADRSLCPSCDTQYHEECAAVFWKCAIRGCKGYLRDPNSVQALPRLPRLATQLGQWEFSPDRDIRPHALVSLPMSWNDRGTELAARTVGEAMGQTTLDGRLRLSRPYPEFLVQTREDNALLLVEKLESEGLSALAIPMEEVLRPLTSFAASTFEKSQGQLVFTNRASEQRIFSQNGARLVISGTHIIERLTATRKTVLTVISKSYNKSKRSEVEVLFIFSRDNPIPVLVDLQKQGAIARRKGELAPRVGDFHLSSPASVKSIINDDKNRTLLTRTSNEYGRFENLPSLSLIARVLFFAWRKSMGFSSSLNSSDPRSKGSGFKEDGKDRERVKQGQ
jgi:hypothetical protein